MNLSTLLRIMESEYFTQICIEVRHEAFMDCEDLFLAPDQYLHHSAFCRAKKLADRNKRCSANKERSVKIAALGRSFCGECPFGVRELVFPVMYQGKLACVCYFTILPGTAPLEMVRKKGEWLREFIQLILCAYESSHAPVTGRNSSGYYRKRIIYYFDLHYMENISESDLAEELGLNCTYFSSLFRKIMGKTFRQALTERRIDEAKIYLKLHKHIRISHIAHLCGFSDSNYFSLVFHRQVGVSPKNYRS
jgi:AraC-like DNA-binding protein